MADIQQLAQLALSYRYISLLFQIHLFLLVNTIIYGVLIPWVVWKTPLTLSDRRGGGRILPPTPPYCFSYSL